MRRRVFVALILVVAFMPVAPCFCGDGSGGREDKVIRGEISSLDWVASTRRLSSNCGCKVKGLSV